MLQHILPARTYNAAKALALSAGVAVLGVVMVLLLGYVMASPTFGWTGLLALPTTTCTQRMSSMCFDLVQSRAEGHACLLADAIPTHPTFCLRD